MVAHINGETGASASLAVMDRPDRPAKRTRGRVRAAVLTVIEAPTPPPPEDDGDDDDEEGSPEEGDDGPLPSRLSLAPDNLRGSAAPGIWVREGSI